MKTTLQYAVVGQAQSPNSRESAGLPRFEEDMNCRP